MTRLRVCGMGGQKKSHEQTFHQLLKKNVPFFNARNYIDDISDTPRTLT